MEPRQSLGGLYDAPTNRLYSAALNSDKTTSFIFIGTKL